MVKIYVKGTVKAIITKLNRGKKFIRFQKQLKRIYFNPNLGGLFRGSFWSERERGVKLPLPPV